MEKFEPKIDQAITKASELRAGNVFKLKNTEKQPNKNFLAIDVVLPDDIILPPDPIHKEGVKAMEAELTNEGWKPTKEINEIFINTDEEIEIIEK